MPDFGHGLPWLPVRSERVRRCYREGGNPLWTLAPSFWSCDDIPVFWLPQSSIRRRCRRGGNPLWVLAPSFRSCNGRLVCDRSAGMSAGRAVLRRYPVPTVYYIKKLLETLYFKNNLLNFFPIFINNVIFNFFY